MMGKDTFANKFYGAVTETAANTLTFSEIQTNTNVFSKLAWVISRLEWYVPQSSVLEIAANADTIEVALVASDNISTLGLDNAAVIDVLRIGIQAPTDTTAMVKRDFPVVRDWTGMPGGGLIISPRPLYIAIQGTSLANPVSGQVRGYFTAKELKADEYLELVDFYRLVE
jgi:hypothetical protein